VAQSVHENRIYSLRIHCDESYPDKPPAVQFLSKVNLPCVNPQNGRVRACRHRRVPQSPTHPCLCVCVWIG
jgi:ubiquitin-protein ligase